MKLRTLSLFSGIGGIELGLEATGGFETVAFCEMDKHCQKVLLKHWPTIPIYNDVTQLSSLQLSNIDVICGGFPCQDISVGGRQKGIKKGTRSGLWKEYARLINELRPKYAIIENVGALRKNGLGIVLNDLAGLGYDAEWATITADSAGYPHQRERLFIIAYPSGQRQHEHSGEERHLQVDEERESTETHSEGDERQSEFESVRPILSRGTFDRIRSTYPDERAAVLGLRRVTNGIPEGSHERRRKQRIKQIGNAVVPRIAEIIGRAILEKENEL
jgi:DNA (cytosine-5)-methyltransferase 1